MTFDSGTQSCYRFDSKYGQGGTWRNNDPQHAGWSTANVDNTAIQGQLSSQRDKQAQANEAARVAQQARDAIHPPLSVVLFEGENYTGASSVKGVGGYGAAALGVRNDHVRSIRVTPGMQVMIYEHEGRGYSHLITEDTPLLPGYWIFMVSSVVVSKRE